MRCHPTTYALLLSLCSCASGGVRAPAPQEAIQQPTPAPVETPAADAEEPEHLEEPEKTEEAAVPQSVNRHGTPLPTDCVRALEFVDYLTSRCGNNSPFEPKHCKPLDVQRIISGLSLERGLTVRDVNGGATTEFSVEQVRAQFNAQRGRAFRSLIHVGYTYWRPRDSETSCYVDETGVQVRLGRIYELKFDAEYRLTRIEYLRFETE